MIDCMAGVFDRIQAHSLDRAFHLLTTRTATADGDVAAGMAREGTHRARPGSFFFPGLNSFARVSLEMMGMMIR